MTRSRLPILAASTVVAVLALIFAIFSGPVETSLADIFSALKLLKNNSTTSEGAGYIIAHIRLPRVAVAALCGAALAAAGCVSQGLFRNALASPSIVGTESGGAFAAVLLFYSGVAAFSAVTLPLAAIAGSALSTSLVFLISYANRWQRLETLLLAGFALSAIFSAGTSLIISLSLEDFQKSAAMLHWLLGGFQARGWGHVVAGGVLTLLGISLAWKLAPSLDILALGEEHAQTLTVPTGRVRTLGILTVGVLAGSAVATSGVIPFVGLVVPHLTRVLIGPSNRLLLIGSVINGATLVLVADILARTIRSPSEMEVGIITSLLGAPYFLLLLLRKQQGAT